MTTQPNPSVVLRRRATALPTPDLFELEDRDVPSPPKARSSSTTSMSPPTPA